MNIAQLIRRCSFSFSKKLQLTFSRKAPIQCQRISQIHSLQTITMNQQQMKEFILEQNTPFEELDCREAFDNLSETERKYLHFYTKVSFDNFFLKNFKSKQKH